MAKRLIAFAVLVLVAGWVSQDATRVSSPEAGATSAVSKLARVALNGAVIVLSPIGSMAGCGGGGGPKPSSATAVALPDAVADVGSEDVPMASAGQGDAVSGIAVAARGSIGDVSVSVRLSLPEARALRLSLRHPSGATVVLYEGRTGGLVETFDSSNRPELRRFASLPAAGRWELVASARGGSVTLESWRLRINPAH